MNNKTDEQAPPVLFKYGKKKYLEKLLSNGEVSFATDKTYSDPSLSTGQQDNETTRSFRPDTARHKVYIDLHRKPLQYIQGINIKLGFVGDNGHRLKYYMWCCSTKYSKDLLTAFDADACIKINNPKVFIERLHAEAQKRFPSDVFRGRKIRYYSSNELPPTVNQAELIFLKDSKYSRQHEFRFIIEPKSTHKLLNRRTLEIGSIEDIAHFQ
ncbi:hypothetical protein CSB45_15795 [candidate division KSB3 bacterium]|uniref:Uncharacterized protein n=1 Tax=candidate division KSB3 bacterium TaxID=2044937 RepID=A0A2G6E052_9BACT|nr:MAG: hypothetical protein CSB45_15795 [candidate division KSB3 bacterium]